MVDTHAPTVAAGSKSAVVPNTLPARLVVNVGAAGAVNVKVAFTGVASVNLPLPGWVACMVTVPVPSMRKRLLTIVATLGPLVEVMVYIIGLLGNEATA